MLRRGRSPTRPNSTTCTTTVVSNEYLGHFSYSRSPSPRKPLDQSSHVLWDATSHSEEHEYHEAGIYPVVEDPAKTVRRPSLAAFRGSSNSRPSSFQNSITSKFRNSWHQQPPPIIDTTCHLPPSPPESPRVGPSSPRKERAEFMPTFTGDRRAEAKVEDKARLDSWFKGSSAPVVLGMPIKDASPEESDRSSSPSRFSQKSSRSSTSPQVLKSPPPLTKKFSFFGFKATSQKAAPPSPSLDDEFFTLDIGNVLNPAGNNHPITPTSFRNLQSNSETLFLRMQTAYRLRTLSLQETIAERDSLRTEKEKGEAEARLVKSQLDDTRTRVLDQENTIKELIAELVDERRQRHEDEETRKRSIALVKAPEHAIATDYSASRTPTKRTSIATIASDSGFESEGDSQVDSVFSRPRASSISSSNTGLSSPMSTSSPLEVTPFPSRPAKLRLNSVERLQPQRLSKPQQAVCGVNVNAGPTSAPASCPTCNGGPGSDVMNTVRALRCENAELVERVGQLEGAVESCLGLVGGIGV
ncbi:MAG: hypothetical protein M1833_000136 [Piccolia ochrophora]|nr:MAG: hypothetical protein M1833_000136 [Piccolia ochrophora]